MHASKIISITPESNSSEQGDIMTIFSKRWRIDFVLKKSRYILSINDRNEERMKKTRVFIDCDDAHVLYSMPCQP